MQFQSPKALGSKPLTGNDGNGGARAATFVWAATSEDVAFLGVLPALPSRVGSTRAWDRALTARRTRASLVVGRGTRGHT